MHREIQLKLRKNIRRLLSVQHGCCWICCCHLSLFVDVSARALGSSSVFFLLIFLCLTDPLSGFPLGSSVKPSLVRSKRKCKQAKGILQNLGCLACQLQLISLRCNTSMYSKKTPRLLFLYTLLIISFNVWMFLNQKYR